MKVYIVIELGVTGEAGGAAEPKIVGVYRTRRAAEVAAYADSSVWRNVVEKQVEG